MNAVSRLREEYSALYGTLAPGDFAALLLQTMRHAPEIVRSKRLTALDGAMSRNITVFYRGRKLVLPLAEIDRMLADHDDNPTFGNVRELFARDCYLCRLQLPPEVGVVLDLGANRGLVGLLALAVGADFVVGVEPAGYYEPIQQVLLKENGFERERAVRYTRFVTSPSVERQDPAKYVSIESIVREQGIERIGFAKIDIEGGEKDLFSEPDWLALVDNLAMELHPEMVGELSLIPRALESHGFAYLCTGQFGDPVPFEKAMYLYASRTGCLLDGANSAAR